MTTYKVDPEELRALKGKTILITGAATGIGRETAVIAHRYGANVAFGDWNVDLGQKLAKELGERTLFRQCDVSKWDDVLMLFQTARKAFGTIHAVIGNAGITRENFIEDTYDQETGKLEAPDLESLNVNLVGQIYTVKCALHYFKKWPETPCQIIITSSAASFLDTPPLYFYCAAKAGLLGFMRSLRTQVIKQNVTINIVAPWLTVTPMTLPQFIDIWGSLPLNQPEGVAHALLLPILRPEINGKAFFVAGHQIVDFEDKLHDTQPLWMGEQLSKDVDEGQRRLIP